MEISPPDWVLTLQDKLQQDFLKCFAAVGAETLAIDCKEKKWKEEIENAAQERLAEILPVLKEEIQRDLEANMRAPIEKELRQERDDRFKSKPKKAKTTPTISMDTFLYEFVSE